MVDDSHQEGRKEEVLREIFWKVAPNRATEESWVRIEEIWRESVVTVLGRAVKLVKIKSKGVR